MQREDRVLDPRGDQIVLQRPVVLEVDLGLAALDPVERRLSDIEIAGVDQLAHLAVEEGQQQGADMGAVHVGVGHDDDLVIARLRDVEVLASDAGAERGDQGADFRGAQHLVETGPLDVQDLAAQGQDGLGRPIAGLLGGAAGGITLDEEDLGLGRVALLAVGELAGQAGDVERALAPGQLARLPGRLPRRRRLDHLGDDGARLLRMFLEPAAQGFVDHRLDHRAHLARDQLVLGLRRELGIRHLDRKHAGQPFTGVVAAERDPLALGDAGLVGVAVDRPGQCRANAGEMGAAVPLRDVVGEAKNVLVVAVAPLQRGLDHDAVALGADLDGRRVQGVLVAVQVFDEGAHAAVVAQLDPVRLDASLIG